MVGGGAQRAVVQLLRHLDRERFEPALGLLERRGFFLDQVPPDVSVVDLQAPHPLLSWWATLRLALAIRRMRPAFVLAVMQIPSLAAAACAPFSPETSIVLWAQGHVERRLSGHRLRAYRILIPRLVRRLYPRVRGAIAVSEGVKDNLVRAFGVPAGRVRVVPNGLEIARVQAQAAEEPTLAIDWTVPTVVAVGRMIRQKGFAHLLDAFARVSARPCQLVIIGEGPERAALSRQARALGIQDRVVMTGFQANPFAYLARSTVFVLSSLWEGFPFVILEAMACGVPVVSTDCPSGPAEIIAEGKSGLLLPPADPIALAGAIDRVLANKTLAKTLAEEGLRGVQAFQAVPHARRIENALTSLAPPR
jgi:glycosyltransferase involved in cell wall biosynthesis